MPRLDVPMPQPSFPAKAALAALLLAAPIAGCGGIPVIANTYYDVSYGPGEWGGGNDMPVVVRGAPFAVPKAELDEAVAAAMRGSTFGVPTRFVPAAPGAAPAYRVVMIFNPPAGVGDAVACQRPEPPDAVFGAAPAGVVPVLAAFCRGDRAVTSAAGTIPTGGNPHSAAFQDGVAQFAMALFPPINPNNKAGMEFNP